MKKTIGAILIAIGLIGGIFTGYHAIDQAENVELLGMNITLSESGSFLPVVIFGLVLIFGVVLLSSSKGK